VLRGSLVPARFHISCKQTKASRMGTRCVVWMEEKEDESADLERLCQGVSPGDAAYTSPGEPYAARCVQLVLV
jgi:hypothetical protein